MRAICVNTGIYLAVGQSDRTQLGLPNCNSISVHKAALLKIMCLFPHMLECMTFKKTTSLYCTVEAHTFFKALWKKWSHHDVPKKAQDHQVKWSCSVRASLGDWRGLGTRLAAGWKSWCQISMAWRLSISSWCNRLGKQRGGRHQGRIKAAAALKMSARIVGTSLMRRMKNIKEDVSRLVPPLVLLTWSPFTVCMYIYVPCCSGG